MNRVLWCAAAVVLCAIVLAGCNSSSGRSVGPNQTANLEVQNDSLKTLHVIVSNSEIGDVTPGQQGRFYVNPGIRSVYFRERGDSFAEYQGTFSFHSSTLLTLQYDPGRTFNLRVRNEDNDTVHVFIDGSELGEVKPLEIGVFSVPTGLRELAFRETGQTFPAHYGDFNFNSSSVVEITYR